MTLSIAAEELNESVFILHYHKMVRLSIHIAIYFSDHVSLDTFDIQRCFVSTQWRQCGATHAWQNWHPIVSEQLAPTGSQRDPWRVQCRVASAFKYLVARHSDSLTPWSGVPLATGCVECWNVSEINILHTISIVIYLPCKYWCVS